MGAVITAELISWGLAGVFGCLIDLGSGYLLSGLPPPNFALLADYVGTWKLGTSYYIAENLNWGRIFLGVSAALKWNWMILLGWMWALSLLIFILALSCGARRVQGHWQDTHLSARTERWHQTWFSPRFLRKSYDRYRCRMLERNPLGWLQRYAIRSRLTTIGWCAIILFIDSILISCKQPWIYYDCIQMWLVMLLVIHMSNDAATHFHSDRNNGFLELLLITPLSIWEVLWGRLWSFWKRFVVPVALIIALSECMIWMDIANPSFFALYRYLLVALLAAPCIGFYLSIRLGNAMLAVILNVFFIGLLPLTVPALNDILNGLPLRSTAPWFFFLIGHPLHPEGLLDWLACGCQLFLALWGLLRIKIILRLRSFAVSRSLKSTWSAYPN